MSGTPVRDEERVLIERAVARLQSGIMAIVFGFTIGIGLFLATIWLVIRGGQDVGLHLGLLRYYFPGYSVTWGGGFVGLFYGALVGGVIGWSMARVYNFMVKIRHGKPS
jgi:hypothetical protein